MSPLDTLTMDGTDIVATLEIDDGPSSLGEEARAQVVALLTQKKKTEDKLTEEVTPFTLRIMTEDISEAWERQREAYDQLTRVGAGESPWRVYGEEAMERARHPARVIIIGCIDERLNGEKFRVVSIGGSGVLLSEEEVEEFVAALQAAQRKFGTAFEIKYVSYHECCGACSAYCRGNGVEGTEENMQVEGKRIAELLASKLGDGVDVEKITFSPDEDKGWRMEGDPHQHPARGAFINGLNFDHDALPIPAMFGMERWLTSESYTAKELELSLRIAMGEHGFGRDRFDPEKGGQPFLVTLAFDSSENPHAAQEMRKLYRPAIEPYGSAVKIVLMDVAKPDAAEETAAAA